MGRLSRKHTRPKRTLVFNIIRQTDLSELRDLAVGNYDTTGTIGLTLGGGLSRLQGNYGLAIDNLISARIITVQGKVITVSETENTDLW